MAKTEKKKRHTARNIAILLIVIVVALFLVNQYVFPLFESKEEALIPERQDVPEEYFVDEDNLNILVVGADTAEGDGGRSDSLIFTSFDLNTKKIFMLSVPRDSRVDIPGRKNKDRINAAYSYGGIELCKETVTDLLKVPIDYYVQTDFAGFESIIDALGGIEIDVDKRMNYHTYDGQINIQKGLQTLNGKDALGYVRFRHDPMGDITRTERQQKFLKAVAKKMLDPNSLLKLPSLIPSLNEAVKSDMSVKQMVALATMFQGMDVDNDIVTMTLPGTPKTINGVSYWLVDPDEAAQLVKDKQNELSQPEVVEPEGEGQPDETTAEQK